MVKSLNNYLTPGKYKKCINRLLFSKYLMQKLMLVDFNFKILQNILIISNKKLIINYK